jgi:hypothetical protein
LVWQLVDGRFHDASGPGALLLCPSDRDEYIRLAFRYLGQANTRGLTDIEPFGDPASGFYANSVIRQLTLENLYGLDACINDEKFRVRRMRLVADTARIVKELHLPMPPAYVIGGVAMSADDPRVKSALAAAK